MTRPVRAALVAASLASLTAIVALAAAAFEGFGVSRRTIHAGMLAATVLWFATAPFWVGRASSRKTKK